MIIEYWMQDSPIKGLRLQKFEVDPKTELALFWIEDEKRLSRYGRRELIDNGWVMMERVEDELR